MNRCRPFSLLLLLSLLLSFSTGSGRENQKPNFIFILVDDLGWTDLSCYGSSFYETPGLDHMASTGVLFTNAYSSCPVCSPTRASIMTGKYPSRLNITDWIPGDDPKNRKLRGPADLHYLPLEEKTIAELLKENGYKTLFAGKWHLGGVGYFPENQGFDINVGGHEKGSPPGGYYSPYNNPKLTDGPEGEYLTDRLVDESLKFIENNPDNPFLLFLSFYTVHTPIQANRAFIDHFIEKKVNMGKMGDPILENEHAGSTLINQGNAEYASMVRSMDENCGRLLDFIREKGLAENTYIIFTSDNGGLSTLGRGRIAPTSVRPLRAGKGWCYEGGIRVPLIISGPGISKGSISDEVIISTDFFPTILELAGIKPMAEQRRDGVSIVPVLKDNEKDLGRDAVFWHYPHYHGSRWTPGAAVRQGNWKLIEFYHHGKTELYDLSTDPGEQNDLSEKQPGKTSELKELLRHMQDETGALFPVKNPAFSKNNSMNK